MFREKLNGLGQTKANSVGECQLSVVIPAFNEFHRIEKTLVKLNNYLAVQNYVWEIVVIDDGSTDDTFKLVKRLKKKIPNINVHRSVQNQGKGHAVAKGMLRARGSVRLMCDADDSFPLDQIESFMKPIMAGKCDLCIGSRLLPNSKELGVGQTPIYRKAWSKFTMMVVQKMLLPGISDTQCGFKAFSAKSADTIFSQIEINGWAFDLEVLVLAQLNQFKIKELAVRWQNDPRSRVNPLKDAIRVTKDMFAVRSKYKIHPRKEFGNVLKEFIKKIQNG